jgi:hypothetical protein
MDHCTAWPDGRPTWLGGTGTEWAHCCKIHDDFFDAQTTLDVLAYLGAHYDLAACVASESWLIALAMFAGLCSLGAPMVVGRHNKYRPGKGRRR